MVREMAKNNYNSGHLMGTKPKTRGSKDCL